MGGAYHVPMRQAPEGTLSPTSHYYEIRGRAAEIARALGSPVGYAEHLFLGMLHDGGWPVTVMSQMVDPGQAEAAVLDILNGPGYSPPAPPRFPKHDGYVHLLGAEVAYEMGASYLGLEHAFLSMIRGRETVPARALAPLVDLDALEAAVLEALNAPPSGPPEDAVFLPDGQEMDGPLRRAVANALPEETTFAYNSAPDERTWIRVFGPGDASNPALTREVLNTALSSLNRPVVDS
jgi:Clp amino terminal domain, pathogenicity island component